MALFPPGKGGGEGVEYGYKGKGVTIHSLVDRNGCPLAISVTSAKESEREQVLPLLQSIHIQTGEVGRPKHNPKNLATDKGYDSKELRKTLRKKEYDPKYPKEHGAIENNRKDGNYTRRLSDTLLNEHSPGTKESLEDLWCDGNESQIYSKPLLTLGLS